jgi:bacterioferritin-associated ferredoxin
MLVCHCKGISHREVERAIDAGAGSHGDVARQCGAGSVCGGCRPVIDELLETRQPEASPSAHELALAAS